MNEEDIYIDSALKLKIGVETGFISPIGYFNELDNSIELTLNQSYIQELSVVPFSESGFVAPVGYFEALSKTIQDKVVNKENIHSIQLEVGSGLKVSDEYFAKSYENILQQTVYAKQTSKLVKLQTYQRYITNWTSIAAVLIIGLSVYFIVLNNKIKPLDDSNISSSNSLPSLENVNDSEIIETLSDEDIGEDVYQLADYQEYKSNKNTKEGLPIKNLTDSNKADQEIEKYLLDNIEEIEEI